MKWMEATESLDEIILSIVQYEKNIKNEDFSSLIDVNRIYRIEKLKNKWKKVSAKSLGEIKNIYGYKKMDEIQVSDKDKEKAMKACENAIANEPLLNLMNEQKEYYKSFYNSCNIRIYEIAQKNNN